MPQRHGDAQERFDVGLRLQVRAGLLFILGCHSMPGLPTLYIHVDDRECILHALPCELAFIRQWFDCRVVVHVQRRILPRISFPASVLSMRNRFLQVSPWQHELLGMPCRFLYSIHWNGEHVPLMVIRFFGVPEAMMTRW
jgi:hypothetical protein